MTEKRFTTVELPKPNRWGIWYDGAYLSTYQVCILLNEYVDVKKMNEELKIDVNSLITHYNGLNAEYEWLKEEKEELKKEKESWKQSWIEEMEDQEEQSKCILKLVKENEKLKSTVKEVIGLLSDEVDVFSDKATEHDINAYVELKELDNKDAYYMATATKKAIRMLKELQE